ncbi:Up-regulated during septation-domain-containing protein [Chlamydoabsidia padenii]|nr:Up-regulated during septation-domain-containing protein [Chlamydoabsidia padenii]
MNSIPIIPRQSSDDDRPSGLKFTRNNYYGFQREQDTTPEKSPGSSLLSSYSTSRYNTDNKSSNTSYSNYSYSNSSSRPSMDTMERPILPPAKERPSYTHSNSTSTLSNGWNNGVGIDRRGGPLPSITSPTLPTRSPQRARDSQTSQSYYSSSSENISSNYPSSRSYQSPTTTSTSPIPPSSLDYNDKQIESSFTTSSIRDHLEIPLGSPPAATPAPSRPRLSDARFSLTTEVAKMWRSQSAPFPTISDDLDEADKDGKKNRMMIESGDLLNELLVSQAVLDSKDFKLLSFEELDKVNHEYNQIKQKVEYSASKLALEKKLRETARSLVYLNDSRSGHSFAQHQQEIKSLDQKVNDMIQQHQQLEAKAHELHCRLLEHMAGVLSINIRQSDKTRSQLITSVTTSASTQDSTISLSKYQALLAQLKEKEDIISDQQHKIQSLTASSGDEMEELRAKHQDNQSTLDHILHQLNTMTKHYLVTKEDGNDNDSNNGDNTMILLSRLETTLSSQKSRVSQLEREMESVLEKHRLEAMAEKKIEIQLRATQERRDAAEAKCQELLQELESVKSTKKSSMSELDRLKADVDNFSFNDTSRHSEQLTELESQLHQSEVQRQKQEKELSELRSKFSDLEVEASKTHAEMASTKQREVADKLELQHYRDEAFALRQEKNKWERMMKRQTVMQLMDESTGGTSIKDKYEQQLEEQEQEYVAQLKEQKAYLDKMTREKEALGLERDQLVATCQDLEELIRGKTRLLDARDIHISELEAQVQELRHQSQQNRNNGGSVDALVLQELQDAFSQKELAWMEQSANMEANFEGILKEFDRLTGTAVEFESERMNYERKIAQLEQRMTVLDGELVTLRVSSLGYEDGTKDTPTTASLRKEFRRLVNDMKLEHQRLLDREASETKRVEKQLKDLKHDVAMANYEKVNKGVQTLFVK